MAAELFRASPIPLSIAILYGAFSDTLADYVSQARQHGKKREEVNRQTTTNKERQDLDTAYEKARFTRHNILIAMGVVGLTSHGLLGTLGLAWGGTYNICAAVTTEWNTYREGTRLIMLGALLASLTAYSRVASTLIPLYMQPH